MKSSDELRIDDKVEPADEASVVRGLLAFNEARLGPSGEQPVKLVVRDAEGKVVGGILGQTRWRWLYIAKLWVAESARGQGLGTKLMAAAEHLARSRGCTDVSLDTFDYQARPFYEKLVTNFSARWKDIRPGPASITCGSGSKPSRRAHVPQHSDERPGYDRPRLIV